MARTHTQIDALLDSLSFELPRRSVLFHKDTELPDQSLLGYIGNPNDAINGNTPGETLLYNCPAGTRYQDRGSLPFVSWEKVEGTPGGGWWELGQGTIPASGSSITAVLNGENPFMRNRYLLFNGIPCNLVGWIPGKAVIVDTITVKTSEDCSGWIRVRKNNEVANLYSIQFATQNLKRMTGLSLAFDAIDSVQIFVQSTNGISHPVVVFSGMIV